MGVFRSEEMTHFRIRIPTENANEIMSLLGSMEDSIEFIDLTKDNYEAKKTYGSVVKRCEEMVSKISDIERICEEFKQPISIYSNYSIYQRDLKEDKGKRDKKYGSTYFDLIEAEVIENDRKIKELTTSHGEIRDDLIRLLEKKSVINKCFELLSMNKEMGDQVIDHNDSDDNIIEQGRVSGNNVNFITGVVKASDELRFKKMIFRVSKGLAIPSFYDMHLDFSDLIYTKSIRQRGFSFAGYQNNLEEQNNPSEEEILRKYHFDEGNNDIPKKIFHIVFPNGEEKYLEGKLLKVCDIFQASRYNVPNQSDLPNELNTINTELKDKKDFLVRVELSLKEILLHSMEKNQGHYSLFPLYKVFFIQEKMIYLTLNKCLAHDNFIDGEVWIPTDKIERVQGALRNMSMNHENQMTANLSLLDPKDKGYYMSAPTYIKTNEFLWIFQEIVNTYGVPKYQEINPAYFNIITFPFFFGLMFGDIGHGLIILSVALYLCYYKTELIRQGSILQFIAQCRYLLLLMGIFSLFCGSCYNEFFSIPLEFFTCYKQINEDNTHYIKTPGCLYVFGLDPEWVNSTNELTFSNSFKMKFSVIIGVIHMCFGIILKGINCIYLKQGLSFFFSFIPQLIMMLILFGYMDALIIIKWLTDFQSKGAISEAPDIKSWLMNIFLKGGAVQYPLWATISTIEYFHMAVLIVFVICVLVMFLPKTLMSYFRAIKRFSHRQPNDDLAEALNAEEDEGIYNNNGEEPSISDFFVHEIIDTIEFVLGTVSNTASYLRLWALSLAHNQLAKVFVEQTILSELFFTDKWYLQAIKVFVMYMLWSYFTIGILLFMDMLECFLHTLRLHWVEFQGKFFKASGYLFTPFSFRHLVNTNEIIL